MKKGASNTSKAWRVELESNKKPPLSISSQSNNSILEISVE